MKPNSYRISIFMKVLFTSVVLLLLADGTAWAQSEQENQAGQAETEQAEQTEQTEQEPVREVRRLGDVMSQDVDGFSMSIPVIEMPQTPQVEQPVVSLPDPEMDDLLQNILTRRAFVPDNAEIEQELT
ncbi:MAG: hypothetical protein LC637_14000, partial [Xanthomonadaceae bacterium]|nr:hypothetical protein [Xanthomonadaceae bacterium]